MKLPKACLPRGSLSSLKSENVATREGSVSTPAVIAIRNALLMARIFPVLMEHLCIAEYGDKRISPGRSSIDWRPRRANDAARQRLFGERDRCAAARPRLSDRLPEANVRRGHRGGDQPWRALKRGLVLLMT